MQRWLLRWCTKQPLFTCVQKSADCVATCTPPSSSPRRRLKPLLTSMSFGLLNAQSINNKSTSISSVIAEEELDIFLITETWHSTSSDVALRRCTPAGYTCINVPRPTTTSSVLTGATSNHGGVAAIISDQVTARVITLSIAIKTFESVCFSVSGAGSTVIVLLVYQPESVLEVIALYKCQLSSDYRWWL